MQTRTMSTAHAPKIRRTLATLVALASSAAAQSLPPVPSGAGGADLPNLGMHRLKVETTALGYLQAGAISLPNSAVVPPPAALGTVIGDLYLPDVGVDTSDYAFATDAEYPQSLWFSNSDPSGSLDGTATDGSGDPVHFNLHWPQATPESVPLSELGLDASSPTDDLEAILAEIVATGAKGRVQEALDILLGTNVSGALSSKAYNGYELLNYRGRRDNKTFDPVTRNIVIEQLWFDNEIRSDSNMLQVPAIGDYTITWKLRGLGDTGPDGKRTWPIDEFSAMPMKKTGNAYFWSRNNWIWKWFGIVEAADGSGRKFALEDLFAAHTGTSAAPSYSDLNPTDGRYWLRADRKFDLGSYIGKHQLDDENDRWEAVDLDLSGALGGFDVTGTDTGSAYDPTTNPTAQFNQYGNNEVAAPMIDWSQGPYNIPYFGYDSSFTTVRKGMATDVTVRYGDGEQQAGLYIWGWRVHPPRINWIETYADGQILASGAPKDWRFGHKWDAVEVRGVEALGLHAPERVIHEALLAYDASAGEEADVAAFADAVEGMVAHIRDRRGLPPTDDILDFPNPAADVNLLYTNLDIFGDQELIAVPGKRRWTEGDVVTVTIHNDDDFTRYFRAVDFGTTDYQYNGTDMGLFDWKPVYGFPQVAANAWSGLFGVQGFDDTFWTGSDLDGIGNPFFVDSLLPFGTDHLGVFPGLTFTGTEYDLQHHFNELEGFSGPGFHTVAGGGFSLWGNNQIAGKPTGAADLWAYAYGQPVPAHTTVTIEVELPRAAALNTGALYLFDPQFHYASIWTMHPRSEVVPEGLAD